MQHFVLIMMNDVGDANKYATNMPDAIKLVLWHASLAKAYDNRIKTEAI